MPYPFPHYNGVTSTVLMAMAYYYKLNDTLINGFLKALDVYNGLV